MQKYLSLYEKILFGFFLLLLVVIPLVPKLRLIGVPETFVSIRAEDFLTALLVGLWLIYIIISKKVFKILKDPIFQVLLVFFFIGALSLFSAIFVSHTILNTKEHIFIGLLHFLRRIEYMILLPVAYTIVKTKRQFLVALGVLGGIVLAVNLYALGQQFLGFPVCTTTTSELSKGGCITLSPGSRVNSTFAGHYDLPVFLAMVLTLGTALFFGLKSYFLKAYTLFLMAFSGVVMVMTASRFSPLAAGVGITGALILLKKKFYILLLVVCAAGLLIYPSSLRDRLISTFTVAFGISGPRYEAKDPTQAQRGRLNLSTIPASEDADWRKRGSPSGEIAPDIAPGEPTDVTELGVYRSMAIRFNVEWPRAWRAFLKNPLLGSGYSSIDVATDNDYLRMLGEVGLLGFLAFWFIIIVIFKRLWRIFKASAGMVRYFSAGMLAMVLAFLFNGIFIDVFEASKIAMLFWLFIGLTLSLKKEENV